MTTKPHIEQVRQSLMDTLRDLRNRENPMDIDRAKAIATVASVLVDTARVENEYIKISGDTRSEFLESPQICTTVRPGDRNGISSITQHKLLG